MGDEHEGDPDLLLESAQLHLHLFAQSLVQCAQGLVQQQHLGLLDQRPRERDPLPLPSGELIGASFSESFQLDEREGARDHLVELCLGKLLPAQTVGQVLPHVQMRKDGVALKHHVHRPAIRRHRRHRLSVDEHFSFRRRLESREYAQQSRLATPRGSEEREELSFVHFDVDVSKRRYSSETLGDVANLDEAPFSHHTPNPLCRSPRRFRRRMYSATAITIVEAARMQAPSASTLGSF